jgi:hypothetical protein
VIAHVAGVPLEEFLPAASAAGGTLLDVRTWMMVRVRRRRDPGT